MSKLNLVILGSTRGTNMQAIIDAIANKQLNAQVSLVISNKSDAYILQRAADYNIPTKYIAAKGLTREQYDELVVAEIQKYNPDLILLIGFMRILSSVFIKAFEGKILNIHPSLLPKHRGLMDLAVHQSVIDAGDSISGCTIHQVSEEVDGGDIVLQLKCDVVKEDTADSLKEKVQALESKAWIEVIKNWDK
ncbi:phosphoribosylglycinamide formyltransferase [Francisella tularensis]|uniref:phosphoribosylglycinamide formyltransferase n=1 Tax=Francisella tularensis TaxID=263 RepID=UPI0000F59285|nr:phosphoribosylglycinamide formyltransferase [Francisella tularensis]ABO47062.1 phosphoribosylglycinamide formyltransferase [Francisella tularensis subsp. tularensis WY96-3418]AJI62053.1 phosphoribosylglycinamide formyltransferase [Francisella tularensis subsp. tularensis]AKH91845.1 phosphoribosylglycinamide formyltransferase [Francisella tularensis subsp. tularensis WY-00W4114]AKU74643.1 phosphoribosylglycinamide formyltransferase [Francisella tularensis subsp. tularensis]EKM86171.1 phospho